MRSLWEKTHSGSISGDGGGKKDMILEPVILEIERERKLLQVLSLSE